MIKSIIQTKKQRTKVFQKLITNEALLQAQARLDEDSEEENSNSKLTKKFNLNLTEF